MKGKDYEFITTESGCVICTSHKHNIDGYLRVRRDGVWKMFHRHVWELYIGEIPEGYEINHKCKNRACSNLEHLECLEGSVHASLSNKERYAARNLQAKFLWRYYGTSAKSLAEIFGMTDSAVYRWIRNWKKELNNRGN